MTIRSTGPDVIRILAMMLIVIGHIFIGMIPTDIQHSKLIDLMQPAICYAVPFHVNLFVLISGYFGIKSVGRSVKKNFLLIYTALLLISFYLLVTGASDKIDWVSLGLPLSHNQWWFMKIYLMLCLVSPILNYIAVKMTAKEFNLALICVLIIDVYFGFYTHMETVYAGGYNLIHFVCIYLVGAWLKRNSCLEIVLKKFSITKTKLVWLIGGVFVLKLLVTMTLKYFDIQDNFMDYNNPFNIILAVLFFILFYDINIKVAKGVINFVAAATISVYLIHTHPVIYNQLIDAFREYLLINPGQFYWEILGAVLLTVVIFILGSGAYMIQCLIIDQVNKGINKISELYRSSKVKLIQK